MRIIDFGPDVARTVDRYGSRGLRAYALAHGEGIAVTVLHVAAGGEIGRHVAPTDQLFIVVQGRGMTCGGDDVWQPIGAGQAAIWSGGEDHVTRAQDDLVAVVVEMPSLPLT